MKGLNLYLPSGGHRHVQGHGATCADPCAVQQAGESRCRDQCPPLQVHGTSEGTAGAFAAAVTGRCIGVYAQELADVATRASASALPFTIRGTDPADDPADLLGVMMFIFAW
jgi:hypothetical protein